jgi:hypothetical protein
MSIAGIRSNRGDVYQTLVAFDWALTVLSDQNYEWLEIDSVNFLVDDVVVGKADGSQIACQCKKNHPDFKAWTIGDLADELDKASRYLTKNHQGQVRFYSRNNFGALAKLREHSLTQQEKITYQASLGKEQEATDTALSSLLSVSSPGLSTFEFLRRTSFVTSEEMDRMETLLRERLRNLASNPGEAFNALWARLDQLGARIGSSSASAIAQHCLTKGDLQVILHSAGSMLVPPMDLAEIRLSFSNTSAIGRSWRREIAGRRLASPEVDALIAAIDSKNKAILLTGLPGSGKTCVMLALQDALENRAKTNPQIVPLFIQSREFADLTSTEEREAQGLSEQWVGKAARMAEDAHVVVIIDSLDVLSIARDHRILSYFLAQIDRLLLIPNITVITSCRDFDRHYDRRISERKWDCELKCLPLDWTTHVAPLLEELGITIFTIDAVTRELIRNPRELALFVELAQQEGSFNVITSQALAQRYLDNIVRANETLGDTAIKAIEEFALEMLKSRSLVLPHQRFHASQSIQRTLCSLNVLQETQEKKLTFGHQTLLDVLVISGAIRRGVTLNEFILDLPPVPFVRPSIRSFVAQLALEERREFRKQIRTVLTGGVAFHIKRLVAESLAEQNPNDDDWRLIRDLREKHRDVFQVIYAVGGTIEWHRFWLTHLVPFFKATQDAEGWMGHIHRSVQWVNEDAAGVLSFWTESLSLGWINRKDVADRLGVHLSEINGNDMALAAPLLERLLNMPRAGHSFLGRAIARSVTSGVVNDDLLWRYITDDIAREDLHGYGFDNKLHCAAHEFGDSDDSFIRQRMKDSSVLLDLALQSIERWSNERAAHYGETRIGYRHGFLGDTSYKKTHSYGDLHHVDSLNILLDAVEAAILNHAVENSNWWQSNRERLCFNSEGALLYFAVLACIASPQPNSELIGRMLCDQNMLEFELSFELGTLIHSAYRFISEPMQDAIVAHILLLWKEQNVDENSDFWILRKRAELLCAIPCYLRSPQAQATLDAYEAKAGTLIREPDVRSGGGVVGAPFSFEEFMKASDPGVVRLLVHYNGYSNWYNRGNDFLIGGEREVGGQLREASSRHPSRFLALLSSHWEAIPDQFRSDVMDGIATYLAYRYGNLQINEPWKPVEEPDATSLASRILDELERHQKYWEGQRSTAKALEACANVTYSTQNAVRLVFLVLGFETISEADPVRGDAVDLITLGINMRQGDIVEALMILINNFEERGCEFPDLLIPTLRRFARCEHPAVRALILRRLPYLQGKNPILGWELFHLAMQNSRGLWKIAEPCLYYAYHSHFDLVQPLLARLRNEGASKDLETWGRISALSAMTGHIDFSEFLVGLKELDSLDAWRGAAAVWTHVENIRQHREQCFLGIEAGLNAGDGYSATVAREMEHIFRETINIIYVPVELITRCFAAFASDHENRHHRLFGFHKWLNAASQLEPELALGAAETYLDYINQAKPYLYDTDNNLTQLMTRLFAEAEEQEEADSGVMLKRVVVVQDTLLSFGLKGVADWLKAAERP